MNDISGLVYLLNQAGIALAQTNDEISRLQARVSELDATRQDTSA